MNQMTLDGKWKEYTTIANSAYRHKRYHTAEKFYLCAIDEAQHIITALTTNNLRKADADCRAVSALIAISYENMAQLYAETQNSTLQTHYLEKGYRQLLDWAISSGISEDIRIQILRDLSGLFTALLSQYKKHRSDNEINAFTETFNRLYETQLSAKMH